MHTAPSPPLIFTGVKMCVYLLNDQELSRGLFNFVQIWYTVRPRDTQCITIVQGQMSKIKVTAWKCRLIAKLSVTFRKSWSLNLMTMSESVASVGVTRAATDGVSLFFSWKKTDDRFQSSSSGKWWPYCSCRLLTTHHVVYPVFFQNWATKIILFWCNPPGWCHPGAVRPCLPNDATGQNFYRKLRNKRSRLRGQRSRSQHDVTQAKTC